MTRITGIRMERPSDAELVEATAAELVQLGEELRATIFESGNDRQILHRYTIADELRRLAEVVARHGDELV
jgi:hypothetical protein